MQSTSQEGANFILLMFDWSTKIDDVQLDIMQRVDQVPVPEGANKPRFMKFDPSQFPVIQLSLQATTGASGYPANCRTIGNGIEKDRRSSQCIGFWKTGGRSPNHSGSETVGSEWPCTI